MAAYIKIWLRRACIAGLWPTMPSAAGHQGIAWPDFLNLERSVEVFPDFFRRAGFGDEVDRASARAWRALLCSFCPTGRKS